MHQSEVMPGQQIALAAARIARCRRLFVPRERWWTPWLAASGSARPKGSPLRLRGPAAKRHAAARAAAAAHRSLARSASVPPDKSHPPSRPSAPQRPRR